MPDDDEILEAYERELTEPAEPLRRSNRGFWLVIGTISLACVFLLVEIFANKPIKDTIAHAEHTLRAAQAAARQIYATDRSYARAGPQGIAGVEPSLTYRGPTDPSRGLDDVSVAASATAWAAAVQARPGACFYLRLTDTGEVFYGVGTDCTASAALTASDPRW